MDHSGDGGLVRWAQDTVALGKVSSNINEWVATKINVHKKIRNFILE